jgi:cell wall-associated NlpC family hydrolase
MIEVGDLVGIPYKEGGRGLDGMDCYGLLIEIFRRDGKKVPDILYSDHSPDITGRVILSLPFRRVPGPPGEMTVLEIVHNGELHVGVALNKKEFIHATRLGVRVNQIGLYKVRSLYEWDSSTYIEE